MPRTAAGGRLPHGPRRVSRLGRTAVAALVVAAAAACGHAPAPAAAPPPPGPRALPALPVPSASPPPPRPAAPLPTHAPSGTPVRRVRGTVVRVSVESDSATGTGASSTREAAIATWVQTPTGKVRVRTSTLASVPTGSTIDADVVDAPGSPATRTAVAAAESGARVVAGRVITVPGPPALRAAVHSVTVVLAAPRGTAPDRTTPARVTRTVDGPVSAFWAGQTGARVRWRVARAVGWLRLSAGCDEPWALWSEAARRARFAAGRDRHLLVVVPATAGDCFAGLGTIGATSDAGGYAYVRGVLPGLLAHELGHNLGLGHSNGLQCDGEADGSWNGTTWSRGCLRTTYRDWYDVMGVSWENLGTLSTAQAWRLGALPADQVATATRPTRVTLTAVGLGSGVRSLRVADPGGGTYVVEYRAAVGQDAWLANDWRGLRPGVLVRRSDPQDLTQTLLLDATPSPAARFAGDWDEPVPVGGALTTASGLVVIRVDEETPTTAQVDVEIDGVRPAGAAPDLGARLASDSSTRVVPRPLAATPSPSASPSPSPSATGGDRRTRPALRLPSR